MGGCVAKSSAVPQRTTSFRLKGSSSNRRVAVPSKSLSSPRANSEPLPCIPRHVVSNDREVHSEGVQPKGEFYPYFQDPRTRKSEPISPRAPSSIPWPGAVSLGQDISEEDEARIIFEVLHRKTNLLASECQEYRAALRVIDFARHINDSGRKRTTEGVGDADEEDEEYEYDYSSDDGEECSSNSLDVMDRLVAVADLRQLVNNFCESKMREAMFVDDDGSMLRDRDVALPHNDSDGDSNSRADGASQMETVGSPQQCTERSCTLRPLPSVLGARRPRPTLIPSSSTPAMRGHMQHGFPDVRADRALRRRTASAPSDDSFSRLTASPPLEQTRLARRQASVPPSGGGTYGLGAGPSARTLSTSKSPSDRPSTSSSPSPSYLEDEAASGGIEDDGSGGSSCGISDRVAPRGTAAGRRVIPPQRRGKSAASTILRHTAANKAKHASMDLPHPIMR